jgi:hypothetical protein
MLRGSATISKLFGNRFTRLDKKTIEALLMYFDCPLEGPNGLFEIKEVEDERLQV